MSKPRYSKQQIEEMKMDVDSWPRCKTCGKIIHWRHYKTERKGKPYIQWTRWKKNARFCNKKCANDRFQRGVIPIHDCSGKPVQQGFYIFRMDRPDDHKRKGKPLNCLVYTTARARDEIVDLVCRELSGEESFV